MIPYIMGAYLGLGVAYTVTFWVRYRPNFGPRWTKYLCLSAVVIVWPLLALEDFSD